MAKQKKRTVHVTFELETEMSTAMLKKREFYLAMIGTMEEDEIEELLDKNTLRSLRKADLLRAGEARICGSVKVNVSG